MFLLFGYPMDLAPVTEKEKKSFLTALQEYLSHKANNCT